MTRESHSDSVIIDHNFACPLPGSYTGERGSTMPSVGRQWGPLLHTCTVTAPVVSFGVSSFAGRISVGVVGAPQQGAEQPAPIVHQRRPDSGCSRSHCRLSRATFVVVVERQDSAHRGRRATAHPLVVVSGIIGGARSLRTCSLDSRRGHPSVSLLVRTWRRQADASVRIRLGVHGTINGNAARARIAVLRRDRLSIQRCQPGHSLVLLLVLMKLVQQQVQIGRGETGVGSATLACRWTWDVRRCRAALAGTEFSLCSAGCSRHCKVFRATRAHVWALDWRAMAANSGGWQRRACTRVSAHRSGPTRSTRPQPHPRPNAPRIGTGTLAAPQPLHRGTNVVALVSRCASVGGPRHTSETPLALG